MVYDGNASDGYVVLFGGDGPAGALGDTWVFQNGTWTNVTPLRINSTNSPSPRYGAAMAYDSSDGYVVLFGGASGPFTGSNDPLLNDTWEFVHGNWTELCRSCSPEALSEPGPRFDSSVSDDPSESGVVLFGGLTIVAGSYTVLNDTWLFVAGTWTQLSPTTSPPARFGAGLSLVPATGPLVLFGGCAQAPPGSGPSCAAFQNDSWTFSGGTWSEVVVPSGGPEARMSFGFANSSSQGLVLAFGGLSASGLLNETWTLDQGTWSDLTNTLLWSPSPRDEVAATYDPASGSNYFMLFGGWNGTYLNETWVYPSPFSPLRVSAPVPNLPVTDVGRSIRLNVTVSGGAGHYDRTWFGLPAGCATANTSSLVCRPQAGPGRAPTFYSVSVRVRDARGSIVWSAPTTIEVNGLLSVSVAPIGPNFGFAPWNATLSAIVVGGTPPFSYQWDFGDATMNGSGNPVTHEYNLTGKFGVNVTVYDFVGESYTAHFREWSALPFEVQLGVTPSSAAIGSRVTLRASATGGFPPYSYIWSGLPSPCTTVNSSSLFCVSHAVGTYNVSVRVTDSVGDTNISSSTLVVTSLLSLSGIPAIVWIGVGAAGVAAVVVAVWAVRRSRRKRIGPTEGPPPPSPEAPPSG